MASPCFYAEIPQKKLEEIGTATFKATFKEEIGTATFYFGSKVSRRNDEPTCCSLRGHDTIKLPNNDEVSVLFIAVLLSLIAIESKS